MKLRHLSNKAAAGLLSFVVLLSVFAPLRTVLADDRTVKIYSAADFLDFARKCKTDTWSKGRTAELMQDIDLSDTEFAPVPTFGGVFNGNGYTISGVSVSRKGSCQGLFRYIQKSGTVKNLNVKGDIVPDGSRENVGGIVGENSGTIQGCSFSGSVSGKSNIGGICGYVTESGIVAESRFEGNVTGSSYTGGICGQNYGQIRACANYGAVNTTDNTEETKSLDDIELDVTEIRSTENIETNTDTGGICGYTKGGITDCKNFGNVGYPSIGYNTGGICGRQAGYIGGCENHGEINGRKDIGGIAGQAEPYVLLEFTEDILKKTDDKLADIKSVIDDYTNSSDDAISDSLERINGVLSDISGHMEKLSDDANVYADDVTVNINDLSDRLHTALDDSSEVFDSISDGTGKISDGLTAFRDGGEYLKKMSEDINAALEEAEDTEEYISDAGTYLKRAMSQLAQATGGLTDSIADLEDGISDLQDAIKKLKTALEEKNEIEESFKTLWESIGKIQNGASKAEDALNDAADVLQGLYDKNYISVNAEVIENLRRLAECNRNVAKALRDVMDACLIAAERFDVYYFKSALKTMSRGLISLSNAVSSIQDTSENFEAILDYAVSASENGTKAIDKIKDGTGKLGDGADCLTDAVDKLKSVTDNLTEDGKLEMPDMSDTFSRDFDRFFDSVDTMQSELTVFNNIIKDKKNNGVDTLNRLGDEIDKLTDMLSDSYDEHAGEKDEDVVEDISDSDTSGDLHGKIDTSSNYGLVFGDVNTGGIVGSMAIEYDFDPEDDVVNSGDKTLNFTYKTKCVVRRCANEGAVTSKKDYSGGIVGRMDLGSVLSCGSYANVTSTDGSYVGGIAGKSDSAIRNSAAKCELSGKSYIGGIAGKGETVSNCRTLISAPDIEEFGGTIAGSAPREKLRDNYFVSDTLGGLDDINYTGAAEETNIDAFVRYVKSNLGKDVGFVLTFVADDEEVAKVPFRYKEAIPEEQIPKVPEKSGYFGRWSSYDYSMPCFDAVITAEYYRNMDIIASEQKRENGKSIILVCGAFDDSAKVSVAHGGELAGKSVIDSSDVRIEGSYTETYTVRYLPLSEKGVDIYVESGGRTEKVRTKKVGSYLEFETDNYNFTVFEVRKSYTAFVMVLSGVLVITAICVLIFLRRRKKHKGK